MTHEQKIMQRNIDRCAKEFENLEGKVFIADGKGNFKYANPNTIEPCKPAVPGEKSYMEWLQSAHPTPPPAKQNKEVENTMCYPKTAAISVISTSAAATVEQTQRDFAITRVYGIRNELTVALRDQFKMNAKDRPQTAKDLIKVITDGDFTLDEDMIERAGDDINCYNNEYGIRWGKETPDKAGYKLATEALSTEAQNVIEKVTLGSLDSLLDTLNAFKAWTYVGNESTSPKSK